MSHTPCMSHTPQDDAEHDADDDVGMRGSPQLSNFSQSAGSAGIAPASHEGVEGKVQGAGHRRVASAALPSSSSLSRQSECACAVCVDYIMLYALCCLRALCNWRCRHPQPFLSRVRVCASLLAADDFHPSFLLPQVQMSARPFREIARAVEHSS